MEPHRRLQEAVSAHFHAMMEPHRRLQQAVSGYINAVVEPQRRMQEALSAHSRALRECHRAKNLPAVFHGLTLLWKVKQLAGVSGV